MVRPLIVHVVAVTVQVNEPGLDVTRYEVTGSPLLTASVHVMTAEAFPRVAVTPVGASGMRAGTIAFDGADTGDTPTALVAVTENV